MRKLFKSATDDVVPLQTEQPASEDVLFQHVLSIKLGSNSWKNGTVTVDKQGTLLCMVDAKNYKKYTMEGVDFCESYVCALLFIFLWTFVVNDFG